MSANLDFRVVNYDYKELKGWHKYHFERCSCIAHELNRVKFFGTVKIVSIIGASNRMH